MPLNIDSFRTVASQTLFGSRDIAVQGQGETAAARLGNFVFSQGAKTNDATMAVFKDALEKEYGVFGTHAFDSVLGSRAQMHKSLRASDVKATLSALETVKKNRFIGELSRQLDTNPKFRELSDGMRKLVRSTICDSPIDGSLKDCATDADLAKRAVARIDRAVDVAKDFIERKKAGDPNYDVDEDTHALGGRQETEHAAKDNEPTGLRRLKAAFGKHETSIEDLIKDGFLGTGMRVNRSATNPVILDKLKTNGVEPGFIYRNDWSTDDTRGFMADVNSAESRAALDALKEKDPAFAAACEGKTMREQILLAGRAHPAAMAAASELLIEEAAKLVRGEGHAPARPDAQERVPPAPDAVKALATALKNYFTNPKDIEKLSQISGGTCDKALLDETKKNLFVDIRDAVMSMGPKNADGTDNVLYARSPVFKRFTDRAIVKLDYNEGSKFSSGDSAHAGTFMRPERVILGRKMGQIYRFTSRQSADTISAGAVTEALANDLTRIAGVPAQELEIVRGQYSDGHPKIMLAAKFKDGYKDLEAGMLKDGRVVKPAGADPNLQLESLGKYKAFFLVTADRDGIGKRGQNKGFAGGKFFAIDPGHSLEGNGKYLQVSDDLSFKDTYGKSAKPRFNNFSVFDDDTFFSKLSGVANLRDLAKTGAFEKVFDDYRAAFNPTENGISDAERAIRLKVVAAIDAKKAEFGESLKKVLGAVVNHLDLYDDLDKQPPAVRQGAVETVANLEKLTSPTTWVSKKGKVALTHLEVVPETRTPWRGALMGDKILYRTDKPLSLETSQLLEGLAKSCGATFETDVLGVSRLVVPLDRAEQVFAAFSEKNVQQLTHPEEYKARMEGSDGIKEAKTWKPAPYVKPGTDTRPLLDPATLPDEITFAVDGRDYSFPKIHYQDLVTTNSSVHRPRDVGELRALLVAQVRRGREVLGALQSGREFLFEPTHENIVALTHALHAAARRKGEYMYRGSFSVEDKFGCIARWLDRASGIYLRTSTHAKPYQQLTVDGHLNMPRGYDVPPGAGGLLNGMRTFHYFTIPDTDHLQDAGGSGPKRRLFLKCETFGIFASTAHFHPFAKADAMGKDMETRGYRFGDIWESIRHGASLIRSLSTPKEAPGIRKENLTEVQKTAITKAADALRKQNMDGQAEMLVANAVRDGGGVKTLFDNVGVIFEKMMPEDAEKRAALVDILDNMLGDFEGATLGQGGEYTSRIGNEIMIDAQDLQ